MQELVQNKRLAKKKWTLREPKRIHQFARQKVRKDVQQDRVIKDRDGIA